MRERISSVNSYQPVRQGGKANIDEEEYLTLNCRTSLSWRCFLFRKKVRYETLFYK